MHRAPAVSYRVARSVHHLALAAILWLVGLLALIVLSVVQPLSLLETVACSLGLLSCGALALRGWRRAAVGLLRWDGMHWHWDGFGDEFPCTLALRLDLQHLLLVTVASRAGQQVWLWLERRPADSLWRALRRAIVA